MGGKKSIIKVRPYRADGYVNLLNRYGTARDVSENYRYVREHDVADESLTRFYEGNGLFAKIIDAPAEEAIKHGFTLEDVSDDKIDAFYKEALDELDWEETAMTAIKWSRLFGGAIAVLLVNDGKKLEDPLDWKRIKSIDDIRVYDRSVVQPDYQSMYAVDKKNPFGTRGSRLGMPEYYDINSRFGAFRVHESRCLIFQNGILPENASNTTYQFWGMPEYVRIHRAIQDAEIAHRSAPKMLDRSVQPLYKMKDLAAELATEEGETKVLKRLQTIDMARGMMNSIVIDSEGEDYDFRTFAFAGVSDVINSACNYLSALTNIPQTILFGRSPSGMNATGESDLENWYSYVERIQKRMLKSNLRYLLSIIFKAGVFTKEIDEIPDIKIKFNPLWTVSDSEQADLEQKRAQASLTKAQTAQVYVDMQAIDPSEIRVKLAESDDFVVENVLDGYEEEELMALYEEAPADEFGGQIPETGDFDQYANATGTEGSAPANAPAATKLPQDMSEAEIAEAKTGKQVDNDPIANTAVPKASNEEEDNNTHSDSKGGSVGILVVSEDGKILTGTRHNDFGYGLICGPGGHIDPGETPEEAAIRESEEEFGIRPIDIELIGHGPEEPDTGLAPHIFLCTKYEGELECADLEMTNPQFRDIDEIRELKASLFQPFADSIDVIEDFLDGKNFENPIDKPVQSDTIKSQVLSMDGGPGSGNDDHEGRIGRVGGSKPKLSDKEKAKYEKRIVGKKTSDGVTITSIGDHAFDRIAIRKISPKRIEDMMASTRISQDPNHKERRRYDVKGSRLVVDYEAGVIVTVEWRKQNK